MDLIMTAFKEALDSVSDYTTSFDDLTVAASELKSMTCGFNQTYWGDGRDHGIAPLTTKTYEFQLITANVSDEDVLKALNKSFSNMMGVELLAVSIEQTLSTKLIKDKVKTFKSTPKLIIVASDDRRLLDRDCRAAFLK